MTIAIEGVDYSANAIPSELLSAAGVKFACRYLAHDWRGIRWAEVVDLKTGGINIVANYEGEADRFLSGFVGGASDARYAQGILVEVGLPDDQPVYFSADFDFSPSQQPILNAYLDGCSSVIGLPRVGMYAGYYPLLRARQAGKCQWFWQTYAWSGGMVMTDAHLFQYDIFGESVGGTDVDLDRAFQAHYGQAVDFWGDPLPPPPPVPILAPRFPVRRKPIPDAGEVTFRGNRIPFRSVTVEERENVVSWCVHGTRLRAYPHRGAPAAVNAENAKSGHRYKFRYETAIDGETWLAGAGGSWVLASAFSDAEPEPLGKE